MTIEGERITTAESVEAKEELSLAKLEQLFFLSYRYSQGSLDIQTDILMFIRLFYGKQNIETLRECKTTARKKIYDFAQSGDHAYVPKGEDSLLMLDANFESVPWEVLVSDSEPVFDPELALLRIWRMDAFHLTGKYFLLRGDQKSEHDKSPGRANGKMTSFGKDYVLGDTKTGDKSIDAFFRTLSTTKMSKYKFVRTQDGKAQSYDPDIIIQQILELAVD